MRQGVLDGVLDDVLDGPPSVLDGLTGSGEAFRSVLDSVLDGERSRMG